MLVHTAAAGGAAPACCPSEVVAEAPRHFGTRPVVASTVAASATSTAQERRRAARDTRTRHGQLNIYLCAPPSETPIYQRQRKQGGAHFTRDLAYRRARSGAVPAARSVGTAVGPCVRRHAPAVCWALSRGPWRPGGRVGWRGGAASDGAGPPVNPVAGLPTRRLVRMGLVSGPGVRRRRRRRDLDLLWAGALPTRASRSSARRAVRLPCAHP